MAAYLNGEHYRRFEAAYETEVTQDLRTALGAALGRAFVERNAELRELIRAARGSPRPNAASARDAEPADPRPAPFHFVEKPVPAEHRAAPDIEASFQLPEGMELPVDAYFVARLARGEGDVWYLVYASHALDPVGEISAGGYWLARSTDGGRTWAGPWYLGLQQYFPYVVRADSTLPIAAGEMIRLEVLVRELDTGSITFPPVGLTTKAERDGVYLEFALADVVRDADGDGLTDIVERRLGTDPSRQDTDGDRLRDDLDGVPLVPYDAAAAGDGRIATAFLQAVYGVENAGLITGLAPDGGVEEALRSILDPPRRAIDPEDTLFVSGDPALFAGANPRIRIIVGGKRRVDSAGAFYPLAVEQVFKNHDASRVYIIWSAGWQGGEMLLTGGPARYTIHELSRWIT
jgi:hypothetical protein